MPRSRAVTELLPDAGARFIDVPVKRIELAAAGGSNQSIIL